MGSLNRFPVLLLFLSASWLSAQQSEPALPGGIAVKADGARITVTWNDVSGLKGESYEIRTSRFPFRDGMPVDVLLIGKAPENTGRLILTPPDGDPRYYAVTLVHGGNRFLGFRENTNCLSRPVAADGRLIEEESCAVLTGFSVSRLDQGAQLRFTASRPGREIGIFRSTTPFLSAGDFNVMTHIASLPSVMGTLDWVDIQNDGIPYFYAASDLRLVRSGSERIMDFTVTLSLPVVVPWSDGTPRYGRITPLPAVRIDRLDNSAGQASGHPLQTYLYRWKGLKDSRIPPKPVLLNRNNGQLNFIFDELILSGDYPGAESSLKPFVLSRDLSREESETTVFLYAQVLWFLERREEAFLWLLTLYPDPQTFPPEGDSGYWIRLLSRPYLSP